MSTTPNDVRTPEGLKDQYGRRQFVAKVPQAALATTDVQGSGTVFDADGREHIVLLDASGSAITSSTSGSGLNGYFDITASPYGATTAATDNTAAIQAAINAAKAAGGVVYIPPGVFKYVGPLVCDGWEGGGIVGVGAGSGEVGGPKSELRFTGTGAGRAISCRSIFGFGLEGIRFTYTSTSFTGDLIDIDGGTHAADCTNFRIVGCGSLHLGASITARSIIRMTQAINGIVYDCGWGGAVNTIRLGEPGGAYVVGVKVTNCTFNYSNDAHILIGSGDAENIVIDNCRFEASVNTTGIRGATLALDGGNAACYALEISNNWFGDAGGSVDWIKGIRAVFNGSVTVRANYFADCGPTGTHVNTDTSNGITLTLIGNMFNGGNNVFNANATSTVNMFGNLIGDPTFLCNSGGDRPALMTSLGNKTAGATLSNTAYDTLPTRLAIGVGKASGAFAGVTLDPGLTGAQEQLVLAASASSSRVALGKKGGIYTSVGGSDSGTHCLNIQAPTDDVSRQVALVAGTTPTVRVVADGTGLGFFGATPVAQPSRVGQLTDSTGGTATATLAAGITDTVAKNAIASLAAKVNALETLVHNLGLSA